MIHVPALFLQVLLVCALSSFFIPAEKIDADESVAKLRACSSATAFALSVPTLCRNALDGILNGWSEKTVGRIPAQVCFMIPSAFLCLASLHQLKYEVVLLSSLARRLVKRCPCLLKPRCNKCLSLWICFSGGLRFVHHWYHSDQKRQLGWDQDRVLVSIGWLCFVIMTGIFEVVNSLLDVTDTVVCLIARLADWCMGYRDNKPSHSEKED
mmetsp:Transcript_107817/g.315202  ORF Transcript_107817/g.315202 Transcript_107817/m.315202 type:complete len:211 (-) Transcript_107817:121-753(-)